MKNGHNLRILQWKKRNKRAKINHGVKSTISILMITARHVSPVPDLWRWPWSILAKNYFAFLRFTSYGINCISLGIKYLVRSFEKNSDFIYTRRLPLWLSMFFLIIFEKRESSFAPAIVIMSKFLASKSKRFSNLLQTGLMFISERVKFFKFFWY